MILGQLFESVCHVLNILLVVFLFGSPVVFCLPVCNLASITSKVPVTIQQHYHIITGRSLVVFRRSIVPYRPMNSCLILKS